MPNVVQSDQFQVVQELLKRQDDALDQLDDLNNRVEQAIKEVNTFRNVDENGESTLPAEGENVSQDPQVITKAA